MNVRVRFAPSPTGQVHIGNIRAAIFNWLFARHEHGAFLLRIEDTDRERSTPEAVKTVLDAMEWLGLRHDGEILYQSSRTSAHAQAAQTLLDAGKAFREDKGGTGQGECVVFRMPGTAMTFHDMIKGELRKEAEDLKDFVIVRSDGTPVFHLANVVDDIEMGITHVIRGDDHVENTFKHLALFEALGAAPPRYAHLPMIVNAQGKPYSKRDGAAFVGDFRDNGYLPDALVNFLALLGWSPGGDVEVMSRAEMIGLFDLGRVKSSPARLDMTKLDWMNAEYMRRLPADEFRAGCAKVLGGAGLTGLDGEYFNRVAALMQDRTRLFPGALAWKYFFSDDFGYEDAPVRKLLKKEGVKTALVSLRKRLEQTGVSAGAVEKAIRDTERESGLAEGKLNQPVRAAVTGSTIGAGVYETIEVLGAERALSRLDRAIEKGC